jgi:hypothetical protein
MLRQLGWGEDYPAAPRRRMGRPRWRLLALTALCVVVVGWLAGLTATTRGLVAIALAVVLVGLLAVHYASGGARWLARALAEYTTVAVLAALVAASIGGHQPTAPARPTSRPKPPAAAQAGPACPDPSIAHARQWLACVWHRAMDPPPTPPTTTRKNSR